MSIRARLARRCAAVALAAWLACDAHETLSLDLAGQRFELELALDHATRFRGLGGRDRIARDGGMLFVFPQPGPLAVVMRDCPIALDVAFLDADGRVTAVHHMRPEPPRRPGEPAAAYEARLPEYPSGAPAQFILETAGGRLAELGLRPGQRLALDVPALAARARR
jgi:uncharacterized membrane protein (UPF0127 family)